MAVDRPQSPETTVNLDAAFLRKLVENLQNNEPGIVIETAHLLRIADNIERLDIANAHAYQLGIAEGEARVFARSNIRSEGQSITKRAAVTLLEALNQYTGPVTKVPLGERALDDKPADFNGRKPKAERPKLAIDLDLSDI